MEQANKKKEPATKHSSSKSNLEKFEEIVNRNPITATPAELLEDINWLSELNKPKS